MNRYEYLEVKGVSDTDLNELGQRGWRVISVLYRTEGTSYGTIDRALLERPAEKEEDNTWR